MIYTELMHTSALRDAILAYLSRGRSITDLEEFVVGHFQEAIDSRDQEAIDLSNKVDALLVEQGEGLMSEDQLRSALEDLVARKAAGCLVQASGSSTIVMNTESVISPSVLILVRHSFAPVGANI